jgi:starvation-inducible DNA-binding protein
MGKLKQNLIESQATLFQLFFKTWTYHYNVTGSNFVQLHDLFGEQKDFMFSELDRLSEHLRYLEITPSPSLSEVIKNSQIDGPILVGSDEMVKHLLEDNEILIDTLVYASEAAEKENKKPTANLLQELAEQHGTFVYKLRSFLE